jgi:GxxExxY protein
MNMNTNTNTNANTESLGEKDAKVVRKARNENQNFDEDFSHDIIGAAVEIQRVLGVGLLESAYASALAIELKERELFFEREVPIVATYKGYALGPVYHADLIVEESVILELKAVDVLTDLHRAQLLSYLRLSGLKLGLLINFNSFPVAKSIQRLVNKL